MEAMKILNVRGGLAANSSSSHSMIIVGDPAELPANTETRDFGWDNFVLTDPEAKANYLHYQLSSALGGMYGVRTAGIILSELGLEPSCDDVHVDHQSMFGVPLDWEAANVNLEFLRHLTDAFTREEFVVLGGNDASEPHPMLGDPDNREVPIRRWLGPGAPVARYDEWADTWVMFNRQTGMKTRIGFGYDDPERGGIPELVDVKITDYCDYGCKACYQGSTAKGEHAPVEYLERVVEALGDHQVLEAAIGGGEATTHPEFSSFVTALRGRGVVPNLTTRNLEWLAENGEVVSELGAVAYSTECAANVETFAGVEMPAGVQRSVQVIDGLVSASEFRKICETAFENNIRVTLLGFKTTGRGERMAGHLQDSRWTEAYEEDWFRPWKFSIDTAAARQYRTQIEEMGAEETTYHTAEGAWSCYIDAVAAKIGASSYSPGVQLSDLSDPSQLGERFRSLEVEDSGDTVTTGLQILTASSSSQRY